MTTTAQDREGRVITEHGPSVGEHYSKPIPAYIVDGNGTRLEFVRIATEDEDGLVALAQLEPNECVIAPGLIYRHGSLAKPEPTDAR